MIICRCKETNKLEEVYAGFYEFMTSHDYMWHCVHCNIIDKYAADLTIDEYNRAKDNRIL